MNICNLRSLVLVLGKYTDATVGVSVDYGRFFSFELHEGRNKVPLDHADFATKKAGINTIVRIIVQSWERTRMTLEGLEINEVQRP